MQERANESLKVLRFTRDDLNELSNHEQVLLSLLAYVVSETNALWRIFNCAKQSTYGQKEVDAAVAIQRNVILRTWSAKLFEFNVSLYELNKKENKVDPILRQFILDMQKDVFKSEEGKVSGIAMLFRHNATNHYSLSSSEANLKRISQDADLNFYFSEREGNSFFPLGEEAFFAGEYNSFVGRGDEKTLKEFNDWLEWIIVSTKMLIKKLDLFLQEFVFTGGKAAYWDELNLGLPSELISSSKDRQIPIFLQEGSET